MLLYLTYSPPIDEVVPTRNGILKRVRGRFEPVKLATPVATQIELMIHAVDLFNEWRGVPHNVSVALAGQKGVFDVPQNMTVISRVNPIGSGIQAGGTTEESMLLGVRALPSSNRTLDTVYALELRKQQRMSLGLEFRWRVASDGKVYYRNLPGGAVGVEVHGLRQIDTRSGETDPENFVIDDREAERWILDMTHALIEENEGKLLRKAGLINASTDGSEMVSEAKEKQTELMRTLKANSIMGMGR